MINLNDVLAYEKNIDFILKFEDDEQELRSYLALNCEEQGIFLLAILIEIAYIKNTAFWFKNIGVFLSFHLFYLDGAQKTALSYFIKAHKLDESDVDILEAILDFGLPPEIILTKDELKIFARKILDINSEHSRAISILGE